MKSNEKFTQRAETAIEAARSAAGELGHAYIGTEHLLLGILEEEDGLGAHILRRQGLEKEHLRRVIARELGMGCPGAPGLGLTPNARAALEQAAAESRRLHHGCIGTEHLLLGLLRLSDCGALRMLQGAGIDLNDVCTAIMDVFGNPESRGRAQTGALHRPLRRTVRREIIDRAARMLLEGSIQKGDTVEAVCSGKGIELIKTL